MLFKKRGKAGREDDDGGSCEVYCQLDSLWNRHGDTPPVRDHLCLVSSTGLRRTARLRLECLLQNFMNLNARVFLPWRPSPLSGIPLFPSINKSISTLGRNTEDRWVWILSSLFLLTVDAM